MIGLGLWQWQVFPWMMTFWKVLRARLVQVMMNAMNEDHKIHWDSILSWEMLDKGG